MESALEVGRVKGRKTEEDKQKAEDIRMKAMEKIGETRKRKEQSAEDERMPVTEIKAREQRHYCRVSSREIRARLFIKGERIGAKKDGTRAELAENQPIRAAAKSDDRNYSTAIETTITHDDYSHEN